MFRNETYLHIDCYASGRADVTILRYDEQGNVEREREYDNISQWSLYRLSRLPLLFSFNTGQDYAIHLCANIKRRNRK